MGSYAQHEGRSAMRRLLEPLGLPPHTAAAAADAPTAPPSAPLSPSSTDHATTAGSSTTTATGPLQPLAADAAPTVPAARQETASAGGAADPGITAGVPGEHKDAVAATKTTMAAGAEQPSEALKTRMGEVAVASAAAAGAGPLAAGTTSGVTGKEGSPGHGLHRHHHGQHHEASGEQQLPRQEQELEQGGGGGAAAAAATGGTTGGTGLPRAPLEPTDSVEGTGG